MNTASPFTSKGRSSVVRRWTVVHSSVSSRFSDASLKARLMLQLYRAIGGAVALALVVQWVQSQAGCYTDPSVYGRVEQGPGVDGPWVRAERRLLNRRLLFEIMRLVFWWLPEPELAIAKPVLADLSACWAEPSAFINWAKLGQAEPMEMPLWEGSGSGSGSSWPELSLAPGTLSAAWGALQITFPPIVANFLLRYHSWTIYTK